MESAILTKIIFSVIFAFVLMSAVCSAGEDTLGDGEDVLTDMMIARPGKVFAIASHGDRSDSGRTTPPPRRVGFSKHQAFRFGKRRDGGNAAVVMANVDQAANGDQTDANLNKYLNKFLEKHKTSGIFRWGRK